MLAPEKMKAEPLHLQGSARKTWIVLFGSGFPEPNQLDARHLCVVAKAIARAKDSRVPAGPLNKRGADFCEKLAYYRFVAQCGECAPAIVDAVDLRQGNQGLGKFAKLLRLHEARLDAIVAEQ
jgi:hypothetical protein